MSPLRPWEWASLAGDDAEWWVRTLEVRTAIAEGVASARTEKQGWDRLAEMPTAEAG